MLVTGFFKFTDSGYTPIGMKLHKNDFDDDPANWTGYEEIKKEISGYVSNVGTNITIHILVDKNTPENIKLVKDSFYLNKEGLTVEVEESQPGNLWFILP